MAENNSDIMATSAIRSIHRRQQAEEQVERHKDQQDREVNKRYSDLKNQLDNSTPLQIILKQIKALDNHYDTMILSENALTVEQIFTIIGYRRCLKQIQGIFISMDVKGAMAENEILKKMESVKEKLATNM